MALAAARNAFSKGAAVKSLLGKHVSVSAPIQIQVAYLQALHGEKYPYLKPWPYETKKFNAFHEHFDYSVDRLNEQSKVIVVEGNIGSGKNDFAKRLAWNFDMHFVPGVDEDALFVNSQTGFDLRCVDDMLPDSAQQYTIKKFTNDPHPEKGSAGNLQLFYYHARYYSYARALLHLLSTGQGVVVVRSPYSDRVLAEATRRMGWITRNFMKHYDDVADNSHCILWKPHVHVFLDTPVSVCMDNIKKRARPEESGKNLNDKFLNSIETVYRESFLPKSRISGEVVEIDWREVGDDMDMEVIAEEIAGLDLEIHDNDDPKFDDWKNLTEDKVGFHRKLFDNMRQLTWMINRDIPFNCPEILLSDEDRDIREKIIFEHPAVKYQPGYAPELGDSVMFKF